MVQGRYFDALSSAPREAVLQASGAGGWRLVVGAETREIDPRSVRVSDRIGRIPRRVHFSDGTEFETDDNEGIDRLLATHAPAPRWGGVQALERRWGVALASLAAIVVLSVLFLRYGLPALAGFAADRLPPETDQLIGRQSLALLDRTVLSPSQLDAQRQQQLQDLFQAMTHGLDAGHDYRLELRASRALGANALALPSGIIVMTDGLIQIAENDQELQAVLAHEIGHVQGRHALRHLIQSAGVSVLAVAVLGDLSSVSALASAAPVLLHARHSRELEREADEFARQWLAAHGIAAQRFDDILCRMSAATSNGTDRESSFLSTHPATGERARCTGESP